MTIGEKIRKLRREKNWTQDQLAEKLGIHGRHLSRYENEKIIPKPRMVKKIAEVFGVPVEELTHEDGVERIRSLIPDEELFTQFQEVATLDEMDRLAVKVLLDALIKKKQMRSLLAEKKAAV